MFSQPNNQVLDFRSFRKQLDQLEACFLHAPEAVQVTKATKGLYHGQEYQSDGATNKASLQQAFFINKASNRPLSRPRISK